MPHLGWGPESSRCPFRVDPSRRRSWGRAFSVKGRRANVFSFESHTVWCCCSYAVLLLQQGDGTGAGTPGVAVPMK